MINVKKTKTPPTIKQYRIAAIKSEVEDLPQTKVTSKEDAYNVIKQFYSDDIEIYESFFVLLLNRANNTIGWAKISQGGVTGTVVDPRIVLKYAVDSLASGVIIAHNHPSGNLLASESDKKTTDNIKNALKYIDTTLLDHLILTPNGGYLSFAESNLL